MKLDQNYDLELMSNSDMELHYSNFDSFSRIAKNSLDQIEEQINSLEDENRESIIREMQTAKKSINFKSMIFGYISKSFERIAKELNQVIREIRLVNREGSIYLDWIDEFNQFADAHETSDDKYRVILDEKSSEIGSDSTLDASKALLEDRTESRRIINPADWYEAWWLGVSLGVDPRGEQPPFIGIHFKSELIGRQIFENIIDKIGQEDQSNEICLTILQGGIPNSSDAYSVTLSNNTSGRNNSFQSWEHFEDPGVAASLSVTCGHSSNSLDRFKDAYQEFGKYLLLPMFGDDSNLFPDLNLAIIKSDLVFRDSCNLD